MKFLIIIIIIFFSSILLSNEKIDDNKEKMLGANLFILDKFTNKKYELIVPLAQSVSIGKSELVVYQCVKVDEKKINDDYALIKFSSKGDNVFLGWIIKSSPSLVVIEHPIYEIKLQGCIKQDPVFPEKRSIS